MDPHRNQHQLFSFRREFFLSLLATPIYYHTVLENASLFSKFFKKIFPVLQAPKTQPEPGMGSALFPSPQTRAVHLSLAESFAPPRRVARAACAAGAKIKQPPDWATASCVGEHLSSRAVTSQVFSARTSLTSVFGMGTGGPSS